jgi:hypothetical protein
MRLAAKIFGGARFVVRRVLPASARAWVRRTIEKAVNERTRLRLREAIRASGGQLQVIIGAGATGLVGWVATDYPLVDITDLNSVTYWFEKGSVPGTRASRMAPPVPAPIRGTERCGILFRLTQTQRQVGGAPPDACGSRERADMESGNERDAGRDRLMRCTKDPDRGMSQTAMEFRRCETAR